MHGQDLGRKKGRVGLMRRASTRLIIEEEKCLTKAQPTNPTFTTLLPSSSATCFAHCLRNPFSLLAFSHFIYLLLPLFFLFSYHRSMYIGYIERKNNMLPVLSLCY